MPVFMVILSSLGSPEKLPSSISKPKDTKKTTRCMQAKSGLPTTIIRAAVQRSSTNWSATNLMMNQMSANVPSGGVVAEAVAQSD